MMSPCTQGRPPCQADSLVEGGGQAVNTGLLEEKERKKTARLRKLRAQPVPFSLHVPLHCGFGALSFL